MANDISIRDKISELWSPLLGVPTEKVCEFISPYRIVKKTLDYSEFVDGGGATATYTISGQTMPIGSIAIQAGVDVNAAFEDGDGPTMQVGDGSDTDRYATNNVDLEAAGQQDLGAIKGTAYLAAAKDVLLTITDGTYYGTITAGTVTVWVVYLCPLG